MSVATPVRSCFFLAASDFVEAAASRDEASRYAQRVDRAVLFDRSHTGSIGLYAAGNLDLARPPRG